MKRKEKKIVYVGLSGGVDSAVSAALLLQAGFSVTGVFIKVWQPQWIECTSNEDRREAMRVAAKLNIPFVTLDLENEYKRGVIDYMVAEYKRGRTPNPDVMCNKEVKFGAFLSFAREKGADYIATGHYAQVKEKEGIYHMYAGIDKNKDQSYFLWTLNQNHLQNVLFPIGHMHKPEVRKLAQKFALPNAERKDSQGLCFLGKFNVKDFLSHYLHKERGNVLNEQGEVIGYHNGSAFFTIGERHGFHIFEKSPNDLPLFIIDKDIESNTITVSSKDPQGDLPQGDTIVHIENVNWVSNQAPNPSAQNEYPLLARCRYREQLSKVRIKSHTIGETVLEFEKTKDDITSGQSLVIYDGEECLGGGIIV